MLFEQIESSAMERHDRGVGVDITVFGEELENAAFGDRVTAIGSDHGFHGSPCALLDLESEPKYKLGAGYAQGVRDSVQCTRRRRGFAEHLVQHRGSLHFAL